MRITQEQYRPAPYFVELGGRCFWFTFEPFKNTINGHPRRQVKAIYKTKKGGNLWARSFVIILNYESESQAAQQLAHIISEELERNIEK